MKADVAPYAAIQRWQQTFETYVKGLMVRSEVYRLEIVNRRKDTFPMAPGHQVCMLWTKN